MAADELTKSLLLEESAAPGAVAEALARSVNERMPLLRALVDSGAATRDVIGRYLGRSDAPFLRQVAPAWDIVDRLPRGVCERLLAVPVRSDAITGTIDIVVADPSDPHPAAEISYLLGAPVRLVRASLAAIEEALRQPRGLLAADEHPPPPSLPLSRTPSDPPLNLAARLTPAWGMPAAAASSPGSEPPKSGYGSEIPIPLTRKTAYPVALSGGTQRPPTQLDSGPNIPGPPGVPSAVGPAGADPGEIFAALRTAASRDDVLDLVLAGARAIAPKVALFVVKKGGYLGWIGTPAFGDRAALKEVLVPIDGGSVFDRAVHEELYLGPIPYDAVHGPLLRAMRSPSRDVAIVPVRVSGKTAVVIVADELEETMNGTRRLEELARAAGEAFARIVRTRR